MANEDIKSEISSINREISRVRSEIAAIEGELNAIAGSASMNNSRLIGSAVNLANSMENNNNVLHYSNDMLLRTYDTQLQIKELFFIFKDIETANKKIRALNNTLYYEFKNQSKVRKIVVGFLDNLNLNLVSSDKLYKVIEKSHLQTPDFWLTYVLLAIMGWNENDEKLVEKCIDGAMELNAKSTTLFMMYFNLILGRIEPGLKWFSVYESMEKVGKDDKTLLMLICSLSTKINQVDETSDEVTKRVIEYIRSQVTVDIHTVNKDELISIVQKYYESLDQPETLAYDNYRKYVDDYQQSANALSLAKNNESILSYFDELSHIVKDEKNKFMDEYIQEIINEPSEGEKAITDEIAYNEEIIKSVNVIKESKGIVTTTEFKNIAKERYEKKKTHDESILNSVLEIFNWTYGGQALQIPTLAKWNIFVLNKDYSVSAYNRYKAKYTALNTRNHTITINDFSCKTSFTNQQNDINAVNEFIDNKKNFLLKKARKPMFYIGIILAIAFVALLVFVNIKMTDDDTKMVLTVLCGIAAVAFAAIAALAFVKNVFKKKNIRIKMESDREKLIAIIKQLYVERSLYDEEFAKADAISNDIKAFFDNI